MSTALCIRPPARPRCARRDVRKRRRHTRALCVPNSSSAELLQPVDGPVAAWAPATVANMGPGFDWMGCAVEGDGDTVTATADFDAPAGALAIEGITGDGGRLSLDASNNCIGIAARETLKLLPGAPACGVTLRLHKGLPLGSGMGSSAASAAAACVAVNALFGDKVSKEELVYAGLQSEAFVSGYHADNIAPALLGGFVLVRSADPLDLRRLVSPKPLQLKFVLVNPVFEAPTREMRAALPAQVPFKQMISNSVAGGSLVAGILTGDAELLGTALGEETVVEGARGPLIPGFKGVQEAAVAAGAWGCTISGAGPTMVAAVPDEIVGEKVLAAMGAAFREGGLEVRSAKIVGVDDAGARVVPVPEPGCGADV